MDTDSHVRKILIVNTQWEKNSSLKRPKKKKKKKKMLIYYRRRWGTEGKDCKGTQRK